MCVCASEYVSLCVHVLVHLRINVHVLIRVAKSRALTANTPYACYILEGSKMDSRICRYLSHYKCNSIFDLYHPLFGLCYRNVFTEYFFINLWCMEKNFQIYQTIRD